MPAAGNHGFFPNDALASVRWSDARKTAFYAEILCRMLNFQNEQKINELNKNIGCLRTEFKDAYFHGNLSQEISGIRNDLRKMTYENHLRFADSHLWSLRFTKWRFWLCKSLSWGKRRDKYRMKYKAVRDLLRKTQIFYSDLWRSYR